MEEYRLDAVLRGLSAFVPRPSAGLVENMVSTVMALSAEKGRRLPLSPAEGASERTMETITHPERKVRGFGRIM